MSARTRAIVLDAGTDTLVVRATAEEVASYTLGQAVDLLAAQGWRPTAYEQSYRISTQAAFDIMRGGNVEARLVTKCGCERWTVVEWPPSAHYQVALREQLRLDAPSLDSLGSVQCEIRRFERQAGIARRPDGRPFVEYREK